MKALHCTPNMGGGGAERQLTYLCGGLVGRGIETHVALVHSGCNYERLQASGAIIHALSPSAPHSPRTFIDLWTVIRKIQPDLIQTWFRQMDILGGFIATLSRIPWVVSERSSALCYPPTLKHLLRARLGSASTAVIANSAAGNQYWRRYSNSKGPKQFVIPNAIPFEEISKIAPVSLDQYGIPAGRKILLYVGRLSPEKNLPRLLQALSQVALEIRPLCVICGEGPAGESLVSQVGKLGLGNDVLFLGYVDDVWGWMKRAHVLASVSEFEGHPNAVLEAIACGCAVIASDIPAHREFLEDRCGFLVNPDDPMAIAKAIVESLVDAESKEKIERARAKISGFSVAAMTDRYIDAYQEILSWSDCAEGNLT